MIADAVISHIKLSSKFKTNEVSSSFILLNLGDIVVNSITIVPGEKGGGFIKSFNKEGLEFAQLFKQLWNKSVQEDNSTVSESLSIELALRSNTAVQKLKDTPYDILDAVDFFLKHGCPKAGIITVAQAVDLHLEHTTNT